MNSFYCKRSELYTIIKYLLQHNNRDYFEPIQFFIENPLTTPICQGSTMNLTFLQTPLNTNITNNDDLDYFYDTTKTEIKEFCNNIASNHVTISLIKNNNTNGPLLRKQSYMLHIQWSL